MRYRNEDQKRRFLRAGCLLIAIASVSLSAVAQTEPPALAPPLTSPAEKAAIKNFEEQVKDYVKLRKKLRENAPKLSKESTPEEIHAYRTALEDSLRSARKGAKRGDLFIPQIQTYIRRTLREEFQGKDRREIRDIVFETELQGVVVRVNYPYSPQAELSEMPATLLAKLPQLPNEVRYRFVGRYLILVDRESNLIIDFMPEALP